MGALSDTQYNWTDIKKISMAPVQVWHLQIEKLEWVVIWFVRYKLWISPICNFNGKIDLGNVNYYNPSQYKACSEKVSFNDKWK